MYKFGKRGTRTRMMSDPISTAEAAEAIAALMEMSEGGEASAPMGMPEPPSKGVEVDENRIYFYAPVTDSTVLELIKVIRSLDVEMQVLALRLKVPKIPIELHIHSGGGDLFAGLAAVDVIQSLKSPIHTYVEGSAASAATLMSIAGAKRFMYKNSFMLIHQISSLMVHGTHEQFKDEFENQQKLMEKIRDLYINKTNMTADTIDELLVHDLWLDADQCLEHGLVDKIL